MAKSNIPLTIKTTESLNILKNAKRMGVKIQLDDGKNPAFLASLNDIACVGTSIWDAIKLLNKVLAMKEMIKFYNDLSIDNDD